MRRFVMTAASAGLLVVAASFVGCGGDSGPAPGSGFLTETTPTDFKSTDLTPFESMKNQMQESMKKGNYAQRPVPPKEKDKEKAEKEKK